MGLLVAPELVVPRYTGAITAHHSPSSQPLFPAAALWEGRRHPSFGNLGRRQLCRRHQK